MVSCSVVICAHSISRWPDIREAVHSVAVQDARPDGIILVIDHNRDLLQLCENALSDVKVIVNRETKGPSGARNSGAAAAKGDIVAFLDDDAVADPGWLSATNPAFD